MGIEGEGGRGMKDEWLKRDRRGGGGGRRRAERGEMNEGSIKVFCRVSDPYWIRIQSDHWIRIRNLNTDPDPRGQK